MFSLSDKISTCGKSSTNTRLDDDGDDNDARVVGGEDTIIQRWPWQVCNCIWANDFCLTLNYLGGGGAKITDVQNLNRI